MNISPERKNEQEAQPFKRKAEADCVNSGALAYFAPISLAEMDGIKLMNRIDKKYLTDRKTLTEILKDAAAQGYRIFENCGERLHGYDSVYFGFRTVFSGGEAKKQSRTDQKEKNGSPIGLF